jgi:hypothetical protein
MKAPIYPDILGYPPCLHLTLTFSRGSKSVLKLELLSESPDNSKLSKASRTLELAYELDLEAIVKIRQAIYIFRKYSFNSSIILY